MASARSRALAICEGAGIAPTTKVKDLTEAEVAAIRSQIAKWPVEGDLRREVSMNIKRLMDLGTWRGCGIARACRCAASAPAPMRAPARARANRP